jgi:hypothetical protein
VVKPARNCWSMLLGLRHNGAYIVDQAKSHFVRPASSGSRYMPFVPSTAKCNGLLDVHSNFPTVRMSVHPHEATFLWSVPPPQPSAD